MFYDSTTILDLSFRASKREEQRDLNQLLFIDFSACSKLEHVMDDLLLPPGFKVWLFKTRAVPSTPRKSHILTEEKRAVHTHTPTHTQINYVNSTSSHSIL